LIYSRIDALHGAFAIVPSHLSGAAATGEFPAFELDRSFVVPEYLEYLISQPSFWKACEQKSVGTSNRKRLGVDDFLRLLIPLPPLPLQRRIVAILDKAAELKRKRIEVDGIFQQIVMGLFEKMFGQEIADPDCPTLELGKVAQLIRGITFPKSEVARSPLPGYTGCLRTTNVQREIVTDDLFYVPSSYVRRKELMIQANDILMSVSNSRELVGKSAIVRSDTGAEKMTFGGFLLLIRATAIEPHYLYYYLQRPTVTTMLRRSAGQTTNIANLNTASLAALSIPLPDEEKRRTFEQLAEDIWLKLCNSASSRKNIEALYSALLTRAFSGELTAHLSLRQVFGLTRRQELLLTVAAYSGARNGGSLTITPLVKQVFLWQQEQTPNVATESEAAPYLEQPYEFYAYNFGPYADEIIPDLQALSDAGLLMVDELPRSRGADSGKTLIRLGEDTSLCEAILEEVPNSIRASAQSIAQRYGGMSLDDLMHDVYSRYPAYTTESKWRGRERVNEEAEATD
jgi:type I restriction enzyme S subunit